MEGESMRNVLVLAVVALGALGLVSNAMAKELVVDKDKVQCPKAAYTSIQTAVTAASPGDKIKVCPDSYLESVNVPKSVEIVADPKTKLDSEASCLATTPAVPDPTKDAIVDGAAFSFNLGANDIKLNGFVIQGSSLGVQTSSSFSGYEISNNLIQNNSTAGVNFLSSGVKTSRVTSNCLRSNPEGVESEVGPLLANAQVDHNASTLNGVGIDASGVGSRQNISFDHNDSVGDGVGFLISNSTNSSISHNSTTGAGNGINVGGSNSGLVVDHNDVTTGAGSGITVSNSNSVPVFTGPNIGLDFDHNTVTDHARGIRILADTTFLNSTIEHNDTFANVLFGILLETGSGNTIQHNDADDNGQTGIYNMGGIGNTFLDNSMFGNGVVDARDDNRGSNTWSGNKCDTDSPPGTICGV
jgi:parallel beta-helix repeat protein